MFFMGVDPGLSGAIAVVEKVGERLYLTHLSDTPTLPHIHKPGKRVLDSAKLADRLKAARFLEDRGLIYEDPPFRESVSLAVLEEVCASPLGGSGAMFNFGRSYGVVEGVLLAHETVVRRVKPAAWKVSMGLMGKDKNASRAKAREFFPDQERFFKRVCDDGRAEAVLLAVYGALFSV